MITFCLLARNSKPDTVEQPTIGKSAATKSGGLFSADDWQCSKLEN